MTDTLSPKRRSEIMSRIRGKNTKPELIVRKLVWSMGYRYRLYDKSLPGTPDLVFKRKKKVIFVHGCFWHSHGCSKGNAPKSNLDFWKPKLKATRKRDKKNIQMLRKDGWDILVLWQCELKDINSLSNRINVFLGKEIREREI
ncbi:MAG: very short patch repair endonuclease [Mariprofundaceae bacterium]|nr:very short patch repair endonuclease [Mariprofundaceae bacterium]